MKKAVPIILAVIVFATAFLFLSARKGRQSEVVVAAWDLPAGHTLMTADLTLREVSETDLPKSAVSDPQGIVGQTLRVDRTAGDLVTTQHLGGQEIQLEPDERAVAIEVNDSAGLAGLLQAGDQVGVTAVMMSNAGAFSKVIHEGMRVLYVSPEFRSVDPAAYQPAADEANGSAMSGSTSTPSRDSLGVVVLAVPTGAVVVSYDFAPFGVESAMQTINVIDLLPALDHASNVQLSLFMQPDEAQNFSTSGVFLPDLVMTPGPSPTPDPDEDLGADEGASGTDPDASPTPTPTPSE